MWHFRNKTLTSIPFSELSHLDFHLCFAVNADDMYPPGITRNKSKMEKYTNIQYPSIFKWCNAPAIRHYPTIPRWCVPKGRPGGGWGRRTTRKCIDIFVSNKKERKRKEGGKENNTKPFACTQKSQCTHTATQAMTRGRDDEWKCRLKGDSSSHLRRSCHALMGSYPIIAAILTFGNSSAELLNKNWKKPHPTPLLGKEKTATTLHTHTHTLFPPLSCQSPTIVLCSTSAIAAREFCFLAQTANFQSSIGSS